MNVYLNGRDVRYLDGLGDAGRGRDEVRLLPAMAGGAEATATGPLTDARRAVERGSAGAYASIVDADRPTPLVEIPRMSPNPAVRLFAKLEVANPTGSVKDRVARALVEDLEAARPRSARTRSSSSRRPGNTGIALAMIGRRKGYRDRGGHARQRHGERRALVELFGAEIIDSPGALGSNGAIALAQATWRPGDPRYVMPYQYGNPANPRAHEETTGPEILEACPELDVFVAGLGTGAR